MEKNSYGACLSNFYACTVVTFVILPLSHPISFIRSDQLDEGIISMNFSKGAISRLKKIVHYKNDRSIDSPNIVFKFAVGLNQNDLRLNLSQKQNWTFIHYQKL